MTTDHRLTKRMHDMLGRIFAAEIDAALSNQPIRGVFQSKANKLLAQLEDMGLVTKVQGILGGRFPLVVKGFALTDLGHLTYCMNLKDEDEMQKGGGADPQTLGPYRYWCEP